MKARHTYRTTGAREQLVRNLMLSAGAVVGLCGAGQASAQASADAPAQASEAPQNSDSIVVTGYRESIEKSLQQKRNANAFVDVITAEDVGKFPDKNVADSLQRVPGIIIERSGGEGSRVSIRGLAADLTLTELNGNYVASTGGDPSRSFDYLLLPSNLIGSVEVFKSPEARLDEGGVGGVIINHTRKPFELDAWSGNIQAEGTYADVTDKIEPTVSGLLSWKDPDERIGFLIGATYQERTNRTMRASGDAWHWWSDRDDDGNIITPATDVNGNPYEGNDGIDYWPGEGVTTRDGQHYSGYWAPQSVSENITDQKRKRLGIQATAQMRPFDNLTITANYFRFELDGDYTSNTIKVPEWGYGNFFTGATLDPSGTIFTGAAFEVPPEGTGCRVPDNLCTMETPAPQNSLVREKTVSNTYDVQGEWTKDRLDVHFAVGRSKAKGGPSFQFFAQAKPRNGSDNGNHYSAWNFTDQGMSMEFSPDVLQNMLNGVAQIDLGSTGSGFSNSTLNHRYAQVDITRHFDSFIDSIQVGGKWRDTSIHRETGRFEWYSDAANTLRFQDTPGGALALPEFFYPESLGNIAGGFETTAFPAINMDNYIAYLNDTYNGPVRVPEPQNLYRIGERIWAGYAQLNYKTDTIRGNIGVRVVNTKQSGVSTDTLYYENDYCVDGPGGPFDEDKPVGEDGNCLVIPQDQREVRVYDQHEQTKSYTNVLPSFNIAWNVTPDLLIRGEVSKVISRPGYGDLAGARSLTFNADPFVFDRAEFGALPGWFGNGGNFDLKPFNAWQYDVGVEWYFHPGSVIGATAFRKDVHDFIVPLVLDVQQEVAGEMVTVQQYSTQANGSSAVSQGIELYAQHTLDFGLGAQVNFTYNDTSVADVSLNGEKVGTSPLVGSAKTQINASLFYEHGPILLRGSYNRRGEVVGGLSSGLNVYSDPYEQIDLNAAYNLFDGLQLTASVVNLTKSEQRQHLGNDTKDRFISNSYSGRRFYVGMSYKF
ncbi:MAG TPA: TonB-dependent receptor [Sphingomonas sp.]|nr:TonB-dependent receptor [Sphingomonas sp.]